jgi:hypothetical protein
VGVVLSFLRQKKERKEKGKKRNEWQNLCARNALEQGKKGRNIRSKNREIRRKMVAHTGTEK